MQRISIKWGWYISSFSLLGVAGQNREQLFAQLLEQQNIVWEKASDSMDSHECQLLQR